MNLFSKDKELILKLTNAALLIWLLASLVFLIANLTELFIKEPIKTYETYQVENCYMFEEKETEANCKANYDMYISNNDIDYYTIKSTIVSAANAVLVALTLVFINNKSKKDVK